MRICYVYFIYCAETKLYKIGYTYDPDRRFDELQSQSSYPLEFTAIYQCEEHAAPVFEKALHRSFRRCRTHGEWFKLSQENLLILENPLLAITLESIDLPIKPRTHSYSFQSLKRRIDELSGWKREIIDAEQANEDSPVGTDEDFKCGEESVR